MSEADVVAKIEESMASAQLETQFTDERVIEVEPGCIVKYLTSPTGSVVGFPVRLEQDEQDSLVTLGDQLQDFIVEELAVLGRSAVWPECLDHPNSHPLTAQLVNGVAMWFCPKTDTAVRAI